VPFFNTLLQESGIDPATVQLVRHQDTRSRRGSSPYSLWRNRRESFEAYQRLQRRRVFDVQGVIASFVVPPNGESLFTGLYAVSAVAPNATSASCPLLGTEFAAGAVNLYEMTQMPNLAELGGLLTVEWGDGARAWVQRARNQNKPVLEIRRRLEDPPFPGFARLLAKSDELDLLPASWAAILAATGGVYLLVSAHSGEQYVGSATGEEGFWSRWEAYARDGHGGNVLLRQRGRPPYWISVLETAPSTATKNETLASEQRWKERLGTRAFGLNGN
jgi:hypothetical protein